MTPDVLVGPPAVVHVVIPARNEQRRLPDCLTALATATNELRAVDPGMRVTATVVLDSCVDGSAAVVAQWPAVRAMPVEVGRVGAARAAGVALARRGPSVPGYRWIACTDADSTVPPGWLVQQVTAAAAGADVLTGLVVPDVSELGWRRFAAWRQRHHFVDGHPHVHGANLGFRLDVYDRLGGFGDLATGEDVDLVERAVAAGLRVHRMAGTPVRTSARPTGRAPSGFAAYLAALEG